MATLSELAVHLDLSQKRLTDLINEGVITKKPRGAYNLREAMKEYLDNLRAQARGRSGSKGANLTEERARLAKESADAKEMENEVERGNLVQIEDVAKVVEGQLDRCRTKLLALPTKIAPEAHAAPTPGEARQIIETAIVDALNELVGYDKAETDEDA